MSAIFASPPRFRQDIENFLETSVTSFTVNRQSKTVDVPADTPLLWVIREELGLPGTKFGCGKGLCGACTVHLNGEAIRSCTTPVAAAANGAITTIEGLAEAPGTHAVQRAWLQHDVVQCGYCQPGQIMTAAALLARTPQPSDGEIDAAMAGNICRCGTYPRIRAAVKTAAKLLAGGTP
jgi:isoquinoline 1-oxidoreductase alpha subunit